MTKPELQKKLDELSRQILEREKQLRSNDPAWMNLQGQAVTVQLWLESFGGEQENAPAANANGQKKAPKPEKVEA